MNIKRIFIFILALVIFASCLVSCKKNAGDSVESETAPKKMCTVKFDTRCETVIEQRSILQGEKIGEPDVPRNEGFIFGGWRNEANNVKWNFAFNKVEEDMTLYAEWISPESVFKYSELSDGTVEITGVKMDVSYLTIPTEIGGYTVTKIADEAFDMSSSETYREIMIPASVTVIGDRAFADCMDIEIKVEGALKSVGEWAFQNCTGLKNVTFDENVELIAPEAFKGSGLTFVYIPETVDYIEETAFAGCAYLRQVMFHAEKISILDGAFRDSAVKAIYIYGIEEQVDDLFEERIEEKYNDCILDAAVYIYSEAEPDSETAYDGYWYFDGKGQIRIWS